jgi:hypothetical protein
MVAGEDRFQIEPFRMGCFLGGVVGFWLSCVLVGLLAMLTDFLPSLGPICLGLFLLCLDESVSLFDEDNAGKKAEEGSGFLYGLLAAPAAFWGIVAIVLSSGLIYLAIKPLGLVPKTLRRQFYLMLVLWLSILGLFHQASGALGGLVSSPRTVDHTSLHTMGPGQFVTVRGARGTRLNNDYWVLEIDRHLVLVASDSGAAESPEFTGVTVPIPDNEIAYDYIITSVRELRKTRPEFDYPLFAEAMVQTRSLSLSGLWSALVILGCAMLLRRMVKSSNHSFHVPAWTGVVGGLAVAAALAGLGLLEFEHRAAAREREAVIDQVKPVPADKVDPANEGQLVIITGQLTSSETLNDEPLGVKLEGRPVAYREVSMLQFDEVWTGRGDSEQLTGVRQIWSDEPIWCPSKPNPRFPIPSKLLVAGHSKLGAFSIPTELVEELTLNNSLTPPLKLPKSLAELGVWSLESGYHTLERDGKVVLRLRYLVLDPAVVTVVGMQTGSTIAPCMGENGGEIYSIASGIKPVTQAKVWSEGILPAEVLQEPLLYRIPLGLLIWPGLFLLLTAWKRSRSGSMNLLWAGLAMIAIEAVVPLALAVLP